MSMINWTGNVPFDRLKQRMNQVFDQLINPWSTFRHGQCSSSGDNQLATTNLTSPAVNVYETDKDWNVHVEHPGVKKEDIKIDARDSALSREQVLAGLRPRQYALPGAPLRSLYAYHSASRPCGPRQHRRQFQGWRVESFPSQGRGCPASKITVA